jgi:superoxide dismutase, Cu-Zn family
MDKPLTPASMALEAILSLAVLGVAIGCDGIETRETGPPNVEQADPTPSPGAGAARTPPVESLTGTEVTAAVPEQVVTTLINRNGDEIGSLIIHPLRNGVRLDLHVEGLRPGPHAVHFHERGSCVPPDFESAGAHFDPAESGRHGLPDADEDWNDPDHHAGDMLNQTVNDLGMLDSLIINQSVTIAGPQNSLLDDDGSALVIHERADDFETQPAGAAGARVACAEINSAG